MGGFRILVQDLDRVVFGQGEGEFGFMFWVGVGDGVGLGEGVKGQVGVFEGYGWFADGGDKDGG